MYYKTDVNRLSGDLTVTTCRVARDFYDTAIKCGKTEAEALGLLVRYGYYLATHQPQPIRHYEASTGRYDR